MAKDFLYIGSTPPEEECISVTDRWHYFPAMKKEAKLYIQALRRTFGDEPDGARLALKTQRHDFGEYVEVVCHYDTDKPLSLEYAFLCEGNGPQTWEEAGMTVLHVDELGGAKTVKATFCEPIGGWIPPKKEMVRLEEEKAE